MALWQENHGSKQGLAVLCGTRPLFAFSDFMSLSIVVPTYNEGPNLRPLVERLTKACKAKGLTFEVCRASCKSVMRRRAAPQQ